MSTVIHFECRNRAHLAARSRDSIGGIVMHHGTLGYCDGAAYDADHRWVPTGGVPLEFLLRDARVEANDDDRYARPGTYRTMSGALVHCRQEPDGSFRFEREDGTPPRIDELMVKLSDDPDWPDQPQRALDPLLFAD